jgi:hypothetical protein
VVLYGDLFRFLEELGHEHGWHGVGDCKECARMFNADEALHLLFELDGALEQP